MSRPDEATKGTMATRCPAAAGFVLQGSERCPAIKANDYRGTGLQPNHIIDEDLSVDITGSNAWRLICMRCCKDMEVGEEMLIDYGAAFWEGPVDDDRYTIARD